MFYYELQLHPRNVDKDKLAVGYNYLIVNVQDETPNSPPPIAVVKHYIFDPETGQIVPNTLPILAKNCNISGVYRLLISSSLDLVIILEAYLTWIQESPHHKIHQLQFDTINNSRYMTVLSKLLAEGYYLEQTGPVTIMQLSLKYIKLNEPAYHIRSYFISHYPAGYQPDKSLHTNQYELALGIAPMFRAGGVTKEKGLCQLRARSYLRPNLASESWLTNDQTIDKWYKVRYPESMVCQEGKVKKNKHEWTLVSAVYELEMFNRIADLRQSCILHHNLPTVLFCSPEIYDLVDQPFGPDFFVMKLPLDQLVNYKYLDRLNKKEKLYRLLKYSQHELVFRAAQLNPFQSRMIAWIDFDYGRRYYQYEYYDSALQDLVKLPASLFAADKYYFGVIDWVDNYQQYERNKFYQKPPCTISPEFNCGPIQTFEHMYRAVQSEIDLCFELNLIHSIESVYFFCLIEHRNHFSIYPSDYGVDIFDLVYVQKNEGGSFFITLPHMISCQEFSRGLELSNKLLISGTMGKIMMDPYRYEICRKILSQHMASLSYPRLAVSLPVGIHQFALFGERCSGTNYLKNLINRHFGLHMVGCYGGKHWHPFHPYFFIPGQDGVNPENTKHVLFLVIVRNPYDWIRSLKNQPWHFAQHAKKLDLNNFVRIPDHSVWNEDLGVNRSDPRYNQPLPFGLNLQTGKVYPNILKLRTGKIRSFQSISIRVSNYYLINYDQLVENPEAVLNKLAEQFKLQFKTKFRDITHYKDKTSHQFVPKKYQPIPDQVLQFINSQLDWDLENELGYEKKDKI